MNIQGNLSNATNMIMNTIKPWKVSKPKLM